MSTIEGGIISTNDDEVYHTLLQLRSHGWDRDLPKTQQTNLREKWKITDFSSLYTFYIPGFNLRSTDLQAYLGLLQLDNVDQIAEVLAQKGADLLIETLEKLANQEIKSIPQNPDEASYAPLIQKADFAIDWSRSAWQIHNQVRGFFPHCFTQFRGQALKVFATIPLGDRYWPQLPPEFKKLESQAPNLVGLAGQPKEIVKTLKNFGPVIQTGDGLLLLKEVQLAGKPPRSGWDFVNGMRLLVGEMFV
jgi:methionyl-tRNA formyltransferase